VEQELRDTDVQGLKHLKRLPPLFAVLHDVGCGRDRAGNRQLHLDEYCVLTMLYLFNPLIKSMRTLQAGFGPAYGGQGTGGQTLLIGFVLRSPGGFRAAAAQAGDR